MVLYTSLQGVARGESDGVFKNKIGLVSDSNKDNEDVM